MVSFMVLYTWLWIEHSFPDLRTGGYTPELAWYKNMITQRQPIPDQPTCTRCGLADETMEHIMKDCVADRRKWFLYNDPIETLFKDPKGTIGFLQEFGICDRR